MSGEEMVIFDGNIHGYKQEETVQRKIREEIEKGHLIQFASEEDKSRCLANLRLDIIPEVDPETAHPYELLGGAFTSSYDAEAWLRKQEAAGAFHGMVVKEILARNHGFNRSEYSAKVQKSIIDLEETAEEARLKSESYIDLALRRLFDLKDNDLAHCAACGSSINWQKYIEKNNFSMDIVREQLERPAKERMYGPWFVNGAAKCPCCNGVLQISSDEIAEMLEQERLFAEAGQEINKIASDECRRLKLEQMRTSDRFRWHFIFWVPTSALSQKTWPDHRMRSVAA